MTWLELALLGAVLVAGAVMLLTFEIADHATWLSLATGRHIVESGAVPHTDPFSHMHPSVAWDVQGWLGHVLLFLVMRAGDVPGLILLRVALALSFVAGCLVLCRGRPGAMRGVALLAPFVLSLGPRFLLVPALFSQALLLWQLVLVDAALRTGRRWPLRLLPLLFILWINLDAGAVQGWLCLLIFVGGLAIQTRASRREGRLDQADLSGLDPRIVRHALGWVLVAGAAMLLNPNHIRGLLLPLLPQPGWIEVASGEHVSTLGHLREFTQAQGGREHLNQLTIFALVFMVAWGFSLSRLHAGATALLLFTAALALWRIRNVADFGLIATGLVGPALGESLASATRRLRRRRERRAGFSLTVIAVAVMIAVVAMSFPRGPRWQFGFGVERAAHPTVAMDFLARHRPPEGEGFHPLEWGGALLWHLDESVRVYVDGRLRVYGHESLRDDYARVASAFQQEPSWSAILASRGVSWVLIDQRNPGFRPLTEALYRRQELPNPAQRDWGLVWFDDRALIFFRRDAVDPAQWDRLALGLRADVTHLRGSDVSPVVLRRHANWRPRLIELVGENPDNRLAAELLLITEEKLGSLEHRAAAIERLLAFDLTDRDRARFEHAFGRLLLQDEDHEGALTRFEIAARLDPESAEIHLSRAATHWPLGRDAETVAAYQAVLALDPPNPEAREALDAHHGGHLWDEHPTLGSSASPEGG